MPVKERSGNPLALRAPAWGGLSARRARGGGTPAATEAGTGGTDSGGGARPPPSRKGAPPVRIRGRFVAALSLLVGSGRGAQVALLRFSVARCLANPRQRR